MNIYADQVIIYEGGDAPAGNLILTLKDSDPLGLSYNELNATVEDGRDVIVRHCIDEDPNNGYEVFRLDSYTSTERGCSASFWGNCGHLEYRAKGAEDVLEAFLM